MSRILLSAGLMVAMLPMVFSGCAHPPPEPWFESFKTVPRRLPNDPGGQAKAYARLARKASSPKDRCLAWEQQARAETALDPLAGLKLWRRIADTSYCSVVRAQALYEIMAFHLERGRTLTVQHLVSQILQEFPDSYWARRTLERIYQSADALMKGGYLPVRWMAQWYTRHSRTAIAGHLLYFSAKILAESDPPQPKAAFYLLMLLMDHHSDSVRWPDGVWLAADILNALNRRGDESKLLEEALLPQPHRGIDTLAGGFAEKVRFRLALLYEKQGRYEEAQRQLLWVVNYHPTMSKKDDALWILARVYRSAGEHELSRKTLRFLVKHCPWSRYMEDARHRLNRTGAGENSDSQEESWNRIGTP